MHNASSRTHRSFSGIDEKNGGCVTDVKQTGLSDKRQLRVTRSVDISDPMVLARYQRLPELGPRILFFSGGTALRNLSQEIIAYSHNTIHLITTFDSGGSSAVLRKAFRMPAVGDIRNRLMSLADRTFTGNPSVFELFSYRFPKDESNAVLNEQLTAMAEGGHEKIAIIPDPMRRIIRQYIQDFKQLMPSDMDLRGANIGNLILTGGYLVNRRHFDPVIYIFSRLVNVQGVVRPILNKDLHLAFELEDGSRVIGQHKVTGKEVPPLTCPIRFMALSYRDDVWEEAHPIIRERVVDLIHSADLICYPMGSFYSSIMANLIPGGIGRAIAETGVPKVFIPNTGHDPEAIGLDLATQIDRILGVLKKDANIDDISRLLNFVIVDSKNGVYPGSVDKDHLTRLGITLIDMDLVNPDSPDLHDPEKLAPLLLSLA